MFDNNKKCWTIKIFCKDKNPNRAATFVADGFEKIGYGYIMSKGRLSNSKKIENMMNKICTMIANGVKFRPFRSQKIYDKNGRLLYNFFIKRFIDEDNGDIVTVVLPAFDWDIKYKGTPSTKTKTRLKKDILL